MFHSCVHKPEVQLRDNTSSGLHANICSSFSSHTLRIHHEVTRSLRFTCYTFTHVMRPLSHTCAAPVASVPVHCTEVTWYCIAQ